ncbi:MAG: tRNA threonylcarbamoyladenosine dehydratase [Oscillospiraceae bacterium]|nr:tRNA threonylcarbamoyladenosine dehydratase [Oscillospiraceae bacterium]
MPDPFVRTALLYGGAAMERLKGARVAVFGIGGVGGYVVEALARSGIGALDLIDHDRVSFSNLNRQIIATRSSVGRLKVEAAAERIRDINPDCTVRTYQTFFLPETAGDFDFGVYDYVVDAVDTVTAKLLIAEKARDAGVPVISAMGTGNKLHPDRLEVADLFETSECPLARVMRKEARKRGIEHLKVVYSRETPLTPRRGEAEGADADAGGPESEETGYGKKRVTPGSTAFVPAAAGLLMAAEVVNELAEKRRVSRP